MFFFRFVFRVCCERHCEKLYIPKLRLCFMFFFRFVFRVCCERPCEQLCIPKLRCVLCFFQICFPCVLRASLRATFYTKTAICSAPLATKKCRYSGALRARCSTKTAMVRCFASVPVGPCLVLFSLSH